MPDSSTPPVTDTARPPALAGTADTAPYVPVSWAAVAAILVSKLFVAILLTFGCIYTIFYKKKPFLEDWLLLLPGLAVVLSFTARRLIQNSEGTRTGVLYGVDLPNAAWWSAVVGGLGYAAYLFGINYSIRQEAIGEVDRWAGYVVKGDDQSLTRAFFRTRDPNERGKDQDNKKGMESRWKNEYLGFRHSDLVRLTGRNLEKSSITLGGLREWATRPNEVDCVVAGTLRCPEGTFQLSVPLRGIEAPGGLTGRQWQIRLVGERGYILKEESHLTHYGWFVTLLQAQGTDFARQFIMRAGDRRDRLYILAAMGKSEDYPALRLMTATGAPALIGAFGGPALAATAWSDKAFEESAKRLFKYTGDLPSDEAKAEQVITAQNQKFFSAWNMLGVGPLGGRIKDSPDNVEIIVLTDTSIEIRAPIEVPVVTAASGLAAARGRLVVSCISPEAVAEANRLRAEADPDKPTDGIPDDLRKWNTQWRVVRIESDLVPVLTPRTQISAGPGGPGMEGQ